MRLAHLSLTNFRNYARLELPLSPGVTVITGDNAQGKSNLLEAILFLATTKSFRASNDRELINWLASHDDNVFGRVAARLERGNAEVRLEVLVREAPVKEGQGVDGEGEGSTGKTTSKRIRVNGLPKRAIDLIGQMNVVMFSPEDIELVSGAPNWRRRYLDLTISQIDPRYVRTLAHYNKVLTQRNHLLRQLRERPGGADQLVFWDQELTAAGAYIVLRRLATVAALDRLVREVHRDLTGSAERLQVVYRSTLAGEGSELDQMMGIDVEPEAVNGRVERVASAFLQRLRRQQAREIAYGASLIGPHRDDMSFLVDDRDTGVYGSRGQQRTVVLSLKLAEVAFMRQVSGEEPILLLDDIMSELDGHRARRVLESLDSAEQVLVTAIDIGAFEPGFLTKAILLRIERGTLMPYRRVAIVDEGLG